MTELSPEGRRFWVEPDMLRYGRNGLPKPSFNVHQLATFFFANSSSWLRLRMRADANHPQGWLLLDGEPIEIMRKDADDTQSARVFTLANVEPIAWSLYEFELEEIARETSQLRSRQKTEMAGLLARQEIERRKNHTPRMTAIVAERQPRKVEELEAKHAEQVKALETRRADADVKLEATIDLVHAEARLYGLFRSEDD